MLYSYYFGVLPFFGALANPQVLAVVIGILSIAGGLIINELPNYLQRREIEKALRDDSPVNIDNDPNQASTTAGRGTNTRGGANSRPNTGNRRPNVKPAPPTGRGQTTGKSNTKPKQEPTRRGRADSIVTNVGRTAISYAAVAQMVQDPNNPRIVPNPFNFQTDDPEIEQELTEIEEQIKPFPNQSELEEYSSKFPPDTNTPTDTPIIINPPTSGYIPANPLPTRKHTWILASHSTYSKTKGRTITPPVIDTTVEWTMPPTDEAGNFDPTELNQIIDTNSKADKFFDYFLKAKTGQITPEDEQNLDISEVAVTLMPKFFDTNSGFTAIFGVATILKIAELFSIYSDTAISPVQFNAPLTTVGKFWRHGDYQSNVAAPNPLIKDFFKPQDPTFQDKMKEANLINDGQEVEIDTTNLMTWLGNTNLFEGGELEQEKQYATLDEFLQSPYLKSPGIDDILNGQYDPDTKPNQLKLRAPDQPAKIKVKTHADVTQQMLGVMSAKLGLDQFPAKVPSLIDPPYVLNEEGKRTNVEPRKEIPLPNLASGVAYGSAKLDKSIGKFPLEIETDSVEQEPDPNNPNATQPKKSHAYMENLSHASSNIMALGMATAAISQFNMNMGLKNTRTLTETRSAAIKSMNCSCAMVDFAGGNNNPQQRCTNTQWNMRDAKGFNDMATPRADQCDVGMQNTDPTTIKKLLTEILWGVNIVKGAFFKGNNDLDDQVKSIKELNDEIKQKDKKFDDYVDNFNKEKDPLTKEGQYPVKPKIVIFDPKNPPPSP